MTDTPLSHTPSDHDPASRTGNWRGSLTVMFTDMKGFTQRTSAQSRSATLDLLKRHRELLLPVIVRFGGRLVKGIGDAFLVTFESPTDAVLSGIALQETLRTHNATLSSEESVEIRVAINTGEVLVEDGDVYGEAVNIAARIEGIAEPNEVYFTESTYLSMNRSEVPSAEIGYRILKGIPDRIKVFKVLKDGETLAAVAADIPPPPAAEAALAAAPRVRRLAAFAIDLLLAIVIVGLLLAPAQKRHLQAQVRLVGQAETLSGELAERWQKALAEMLTGQREVDSRLPMADRVRAFRGELIAFIQQRGLQRRSRRDLLAVMESDPAMRERIKAFRDEVASELRGAISGWLGDPSMPLPSGLALPASVEKHRQAVTRWQARQRQFANAGALGAILLLLVHAWIGVGWRGRTLGKHWLRLHVVRADGSRPGWLRGLVRALGYLPSAGFFAAGFAWTWVDRRRRGWHDLIAGTCVVPGRPPVPAKQGRVEVATRP